MPLYDEALDDNGASPAAAATHDSITMTDDLIDGNIFAADPPHTTSSSSPDTDSFYTSSPRRPSRRNTASTTSAGDQAATCRICRSEGTPDEPLFYPCKCSGSIKFVHQECLMEWLSHSHKKHCELCKTPFRFTKLYNADMPSVLPWSVFLRRGCIHVGQSVIRGFRALLVAAVWLVILPWLIRWAWRWMFWLADARFARDALIREHRRSLDTPAETEVMSLSAVAFKMVQERVFGGADLQGNHTANTTSLPYLANALGLDFPGDQESLLSSWTYIAALTSDPDLNRVILDVFEGQLITCVVITGFILIFLIREWVVQQQPLVNLDNAIHAQQQLREAAERVHADNERLRRQQELLEQARRRLVDLQNQVQAESEDGQAQDQEWFEVGRARSRSDPGIVQPGGSSLAHAAPLASEETATPEHASAGRRPPMPDRDRVSRATQIQRLLEEAEDAFRSNPLAADGGDTRQSDLHQNGEPTVEARDGNTFDSEQSPPQKHTPDSTGSTTGVPSRAEQPLVQEAGAPPEWDEIPITNAGPDAKLNIKLRGNGRSRLVPEPKQHKGTIVGDAELKRRLEEDEALKRLEAEIASESVARSEVATRGSSVDDVERMAEDGNIAGTADSTTNEGLRDHAAGDDTISTRVASIFREEFGLDEVEDLEDLRHGGAGTGTPHEDALEQAAAPPQGNARPSMIARLADWFWGDILPPAHGAEPVLAANEERVGGDGIVQQEAPFVPIVNDVHEAAGPNAMQADFDQMDDGQPPDPEVVAAAQAAGLDPEAVEEAEDLEGVLELVGLQGPLIGLFQTSSFCAALVICTVFGTIGLPYVWGKLVLTFIATPYWFLLQMPLQVASFVTDFIVDVTLLVGGWCMLVIAAIANGIVMALQLYFPELDKLQFTQSVADFAATTARASGGRIAELFVKNNAVEGANGWNWALVWASVHARLSLKSLEAETSGAIKAMTAGLKLAVRVFSTASPSDPFTVASAYLSRVPALVTESGNLLQPLMRYYKPLEDLFQGIRRGSLTFQTPEAQPFDLALANWSSGDRSLAIVLGYIALSMMAAVYVAMDTPISRSESGRMTEKMVQNTLRQAGGVLKVILIISIEMIVFPLYCGLLLDLAFLPLFKDATVVSRWQWAGERPYLFGFTHWFVGTAYMFHFALFVGMCRKMLRKGVLWFIRDPDDPTSHPVRDVLERNVTTQLRKIAFSALIYGALVILCLGGVIWTIGKVIPGLFPIYWVSTEPVLEFPLDLLLYNAVAPFVVRLFRPSDAVHRMYEWWLRRCAGFLRLSHFLFDERKLNEEGHVVYRTWLGFFDMLKASMYMGRSRDGDAIHNSQDIDFERNGKYVLTPCSDQYRPPKPGDAFLHTEGNTEDYDVYIADKNGKRNEHFTAVYVPPGFRVRISVFMACLWAFSAFMGLGATLVPLFVGRALFAVITPVNMRINDIYAYSAGAYILGFLTVVIVRARSRMSKLDMPIVDIKAWLQPMKKGLLRVGRCLYVYGFMSVVLPILCALLIQFYLIMPLHTLSASLRGTGHTALSPARNSTILVEQSSNVTMTEYYGTTGHTAQGLSAQLPSVAQHSIHVLQDYCLGIIYVRLITRFVVTSPSSRAAEAFRRITANGYFSPDVRLATRYVVLPALLFSTLAFIFPPLVASVAIFIMQHTHHPVTLATDHITKIYRYSYPLAAGWTLAVASCLRLGEATARWRQAIRDEVYLVGERLHNFGEKRPPAGSRSVVRKER